MNEINAIFDSRENVVMREENHHRELIICS